MRSLILSLVLATSACNLYPAEQAPPAPTPVPPVTIRVNEPARTPPPPAPVDSIHVEVGSDGLTLEAKKKVK
jgi:hypothetical protein